MRSIKNQSGVGGERREEPSGDVTTKYEGLSENELMVELMKNVSAAKSDGTFSESDIDEFVAFVSPSLDEQSRARLDELVRMIKAK